MNRLVVFIILVLVIVSCKKDDPDNNSYLNPWLGGYSGQAFIWSSFPISDFNMIHNEDYNDVDVSIVKASKDSCININIVYSEKNDQTIEDIKINADGTYFSDWGGGSGYGCYQISFENDSLKFDHFQKCGIPCSSGLVIDIPKG